MSVTSWILTFTGFWSHIHNSFMQILIFPKHLSMCFPQGQLYNALDKAFSVCLVLSAFSYQFLQFPITFKLSKNLKRYISSHFCFFLLTNKSYRPLRLKANCMSGLKKKNILPDIIFKLLRPHPLSYMSAMSLSLITCFGRLLASHSLSFTTLSKYSTFLLPDIHDKACH